MITLQKDKFRDFIERYSLSILLIIFIIELTCVIARFFVPFDVIDMISPWMDGIEKYGLFNMYSPNDIIDYPMDYPPLYYTLMFFFTRFKHFTEATHFANQYWEYISFPLFLNCLFTIFLNLKVNKLASLLWAFTPFFIIDMAVAGQSDVLLCSLLFLFFYFYIKKKNFIVTSILFTIICLTKLQGCYLAPVYLIMLFDKNFDKKERIKGFFIALFIGIAVWAPFCIAEQNIKLPFEKYLYGFDNYSHTISTESPANIWAFFSNVYFTTPEVITSIKITSKVLLAFSVLILFFIYKKTKNILYSTFAYYFIIYFINFGQRMRYGLYSVGIILIFLMLKDFKVSEELKSQAKLLFISNTLLFSIYKIRYMNNFVHPLYYLTKPFGFCPTEPYYTNVFEKGFDFLIYSLAIIINFIVFEKIILYVKNYSSEKNKEDIL